MLNSACGHAFISAARSSTSRARMWRSSGRGWIVMPSAPASNAKVAAPTRFGMSSARLLRSSATLLTLTERAVRPRWDSSPLVTRGFIVSAAEWNEERGRSDDRSALEVLRLDHHLARAQGRRAQMIVKLGAQDALQF